MSKMVNRLRLKQTVIRRFVNDSDDEEVEECYRSCSSEIQIIGEKRAKQNDSETNSVDSKLSPSSKSSKNNKFENIKVFVQTYGETVQRVVDITGDSSDPFIRNSNKIKTQITETLDKLMGCKDLNQLTTALSKTSSDSKSKRGSASSQQTNKEHKSKVRPKKSKSEKQDKSEDLKNSSNEIYAKIKELELEGIRPTKKTKKSKLTNDFCCLVCDITLNSIDLASDHSKCDSHTRQKYGDQLKGIDALFTIDSEDIGDVRIAIERAKQLKNISAKDKEKYIDHGIRLKDGFGFNAFICSKCNLCFESLEEVVEHMNNMEVLPSNQTYSKADDIPEKPLSSSPNRVDQKLHLEGIKATDGSFYCIFCNIFFECKRIAVSHISDSRHKRQKRCENLNEIDSKFTVESERIDDLEVAFGRKLMLKSISPKTKMEFTQQSIRLRDGIGENAFICQICGLPIGSVDEIQEHIKSTQHLML